MICKIPVIPGLGVTSFWFLCLVFFNIRTSPAFFFLKIRKLVSQLDRLWPLDVDHDYWSLLRTPTLATSHRSDRHLCRRIWHLKARTPRLRETSQLSQNVEPDRRSPSASCPPTKFCPFRFLRSRRFCYRWDKACVCPSHRDGPLGTPLQSFPDLSSFPAVFRFSLRFCTEFHFPVNIMWSSAIRATPSHV